jgi:hypothetical protein
MITSASDLGKLCGLSFQVLSMLIILTHMSLSMNFDKCAHLKTDMLPCSCILGLD